MSNKNKIQPRIFEDAVNVPVDKRLQSGFLFLERISDMNNGEIISKVHNSMYHQVKKNGMATPVQVIIDLGYLSQADYDRWRFGKGVDYLERVCKVNLHKLSFIMKQVRAYARKNDLKPSFTFYKQYGRKGKHTIKLRFSKYGDEGVEKGYATHYVSAKRMAEIKQERNNENKSKGNIEDSVVASNKTIQAE